MQIRTIRIGYEAFKRKFEPFERELKYTNLNTSNEIRSIWRLLLTFERDSKNTNANSNHLKGILNNPMQIRTIRKGFKAFEAKFEPFERDSNHSNAHSNNSKGFEAFECKFEPFETDLKFSKQNSNHSKGIWSIRMHIWIIQKGLEAFETKFESF